jgi:hypothetical protein
MTTGENMADPLTDPPSVGLLNLRSGGVCAIVGAAVFATVRLLHGDPPAADPEAVLIWRHARAIQPCISLQCSLH